MKATIIISLIGYWYYFLHLISLVNNYLVKLPPCGRGLVQVVHDNDHHPPLQFHLQHPHVMFLLSFKISYVSDFHLSWRLDICKFVYLFVATRFFLTHVPIPWNMLSSHQESIQQNTLVLLCCIHSWILAFGAPM